VGRLRDWARAIKRDIVAIWLAGRDPRVPWPVKLLALLVAGYALSPIDLIPDFIPILGYLDDVLLLPLGILLVVRLLPPDLLAEHRAAAVGILDRPVSKRGLFVIIALWLVAAVFAGWLAWRWFATR
jgi:uncharacterized membrane protein YkvA (DUF1232 family)